MNLRKDQLYESTFKPQIYLSVSESYCSWAFRGKPLLVGVSSVLTVFSTDFFFKEIDITLQLLAMDVSAQVTMKDAAKCDKRCEWQNSANQENAERILHF